MQYNVVCLGNLVQLQALVVSRMDLGWKPIGGIAVTDDDRGKDMENPIERRTGKLWAQTMVRETPPFRDRGLKSDNKRV